MFLSIIFGILKFIGFSVGSSLAMFLFVGTINLVRGKVATIRLGASYFAIGFLISLAYHLIKWSV